MCKIVSWNAGGLTAPRKVRMLQHLITTHDIVCVQETRTESDRDLPRGPWKVYGSHYSSASRGTAVLIANRLQHTVLASSTDTAGRMVKVQIQIDNSTFTIVSIYAPQATEREGQAAFFSSLPIDQDTILLGDFNLVVDPLLDKSHSTQRDKHLARGSRARNSLQALTSTHYLCDIWRHHNPSTTMYTYHYNRLHNGGSAGSRLDRIMVPSTMVHQCRKPRITPTAASDHYPVSLEIDTSLVERGYDRYFFNTSLLKDRKFVVALTDHIRFLTTHSPRSTSTSPGRWWDTLKQNIVRWVRSTSAILEAARVKRLHTLRLRVAQLDTDSHLPTSDNHVAIRAALMAALDTAELHEYEGAMIRSKMQLECGLQTKKTALRLEARTAKQRTISHLVHNGITFTRPEDMLNVAREFWGKLFHAPEFGPYEPTCPLAQEHMLRRYTNTLLRLDVHDYELLNRHVSLEELTESLPSLPNKKSNGPDGLPYEFYRHTEVWELIGEDFTKVMENSIMNEHLPKSQREADMVPIFKEQGQREAFKEYRPITVSNCDYRIFMVVIVKRLNIIVGKYIVIDQTGFIPGRQITSNGVLISSLIEYMLDEPSQITGGIVFLDFQKAFDSVEWDWIVKVFQARNFPPFFISLLKATYKGLTANVVINGFRAPVIQLNRGVRQGCPLSPLIFAFIIEPLYDMLREGIRGIRIPHTDRCVKVSGFADDTTPLIRDWRDWVHLHDLLKLFAKASGLKVNNDKLAGFWLAPDGVPPDPRLRDVMRWTPPGQYERHLGFRVGIRVSGQEQFLHVTSKIQARLTALSCSIFSFRGRVMALKTFVHSSIWYFTQIASVPHSILHQWNTWCYNFIWDRGGKYSPTADERAKPGKVSREKLAQTTANGGLNLLPLQLQIDALRTKMAVELLKDDIGIVPFWKDLVISRLYSAAGKKGGTSLLLIRTPLLILTPLNRFHGLPPLWKEIMGSLAKHTFLMDTPTTPHHILDQPLFFNAYLPAVSAQVLHTSPTEFAHSVRKTWIQGGILRVRDIIDPSGEPFPIAHMLAHHPLAQIPEHVLLRTQLAIPNAWRQALAQYHAGTLVPHNPPQNHTHWISITTGPGPDQKVVLASLTTKLIKTIVRERDHPWSPPPPTSFCSWQNSHHMAGPVFQPDTTLAKAWVASAAPYLTHKHKDLLWLLAHRQLNVYAHTRMRVWSCRLNAQQGCPYCGVQLETIEHCLYDCPQLMVHLWPKLHTFINAFVSSVIPPQLHRRLILLGDVDDKDRQWAIIRATAVSTLWRHRGEAMLMRAGGSFDHPPPPGPPPPLAPVPYYSIFTDFFRHLTFYANAEFRKASTLAKMHAFSTRWRAGTLLVFRNQRLHILPSPRIPPLAVCPCDSPRRLHFPPLPGSRPDRNVRCHCGGPPVFVTPPQVP